LGGKKALLVTDKGLRAIKDGAVDKPSNICVKPVLTWWCLTASSQTLKTPTCATAWTFS
jgi:hypothetical protein